MAVTITITKPTPETWVVDIVETATSNAETRTINPISTQRIPRVGRVMRVVSALVSGSGTTIAPVLSSTTTFTSTDVVCESDADAGPVDEQPSGGFRYGMTSNSLYHRSNPDSGSDNVIHTRYLIKSGWE